MAQKSIECEVVKVLQETPAGSGTNQLRIVRWIVDGKDTGALLEKRNFFPNKDSNEPKIGKAKGFNKEDLKLIVNQWSELESLM